MASLTDAERARLREVARAAMREVLRTCSPIDGWEAITAALERAVSDERARCERAVAEVRWHMGADELTDDRRALLREGLHHIADAIARGT